MLKHVVAALVLLMPAAAPAWADLRYTLHTEARPVALDDTAPPVPGMSGSLIIKAMFPEGATETTYTISDRGTRVEFKNASAIMPAGAVMLRHADGTMVIMNPREQTYWKLSMPDLTSPQAAAMIAQFQPDVSVVHTGEFATVAGIRAEHVTYAMTMKIALPEGVALPPGMPTSVTSTADLWMTNQYDADVDRTPATAQFSSNLLGLLSKMPRGLALRSVMRSSMLAGYEIESVVTQIDDGPAPAELFEIPTAYKEVPPLIAMPQQAAPPPNLP